MQKFLVAGAATTVAAVGVAWYLRRRALAAEHGQCDDQESEAESMTTALAGESAPPEAVSSVGTEISVGTARAWERPQGFEEAGPRRIRYRSKTQMYFINPHTVIDDRIVIAMVGLPARGKSYISKAIVRYLTFFGCPIQLFNAGNKRRLDGHAGADASFFDPANTQASPHRC